MSIKDITLFVNYLGALVEVLVNNIPCFFRTQIFLYIYVNRSWFYLFKRWFLIIEEAMALKEEFSTIIEVSALGFEVDWGNIEVYI